MRRTYFRWFSTGIPCLLAVAAVAADGQAQENGGINLPEWSLPPTAGPVVTPDQATRALQITAVRGEDRLQSNGERPRGPARKLYPKLAPATVVVYAGNGYGTGFVVDEEGWILTNSHVVEGTGVDPQTGARVTPVFLGRLRDGIMQVREEPIPAVVYKDSEAQDLALLKLKEVPEALSPLPTIPLAEQTPVPGEDCVVIGHPRSGLLWTIRSGEVASIGTWPRDMIDTVLARLTLTGEDRRQLSQRLAEAQKRRVLLSTCGINPGDSGGPLVNNDGELIAVTFAIPSGGEEQQISLDKFSYHVHLNEVKAFLKDRPEQPPIHVPDVWPPALLSMLADQDEDGTPETWLFGLKEDQAPSGLLFDLDQDSPADFQPEFVDDPEKRETWDFEFAVQNVPFTRTFYDTDNDGETDVILTNTNDSPDAEVILRDRDGTWTVSPEEDLLMVDPFLFEDSYLQRRLAEMMQR